MNVRVYAGNPCGILPLFQSRSLWISAVIVLLGGELKWSTARDTTRGGSRLFGSRGAMMVHAVPVVSHDTTVHDFPALAWRSNMHRLLAIFIWISAAHAQSVLDGSDQKLGWGDSRAMKKAVLEALGSDTAYFYSLNYQKTADGDNRDVICGIVGGAGEYAFYYTVSIDEATLLPKQMGSGGRDLLLQELVAIGCPVPE